MQVDPEARKFSDIRSIDEMEQGEQLTKDPVVVTSEDRAKLEQLQRDLESAGYEKA